MANKYLSEYCCWKDAFLRTGLHRDTHAGGKLNVLEIVRTEVHRAQSCTATGKGGAKAGQAKAGPDGLTPKTKAGELCVRWYFPGRSNKRESAAPDRGLTRMF
jgi:hypothetical protein